jgi:hypothetical protein
LRRMLSSEKREGYFGGVLFTLRTSRGGEHHTRRDRARPRLLPMWSCLPPPRRRRAIARPSCCRTTCTRCVDSMRGRWLQRFGRTGGSGIRKSAWGSSQVNISDVEKCFNPRGAGADEDDLDNSRMFSGCGGRAFKKMA